MMAKTPLRAELLRIAQLYRTTQPQLRGGVVLIAEGKAIDWKPVLPSARNQKPDTVAVDQDGAVFITEGGTTSDGAKCWIVAKSLNS